MQKKRTKKKRTTTQQQTVWFSAHGDGVGGGEDDVWLHFIHRYTFTLLLLLLRLRET